MPALLLAAAVVLFASVLVVNRSHLQTANSGDTVGPNRTGVPVQLVRGYRYQVYRESGAAAKAKATCQVAAKGASSGQTVPLGDASKSYHAQRITNSGKEYVFLGDFVAPKRQSATVRCPGQSATLLVRPDDRPLMILTRALMISLGLVVVAVVAFVALLALRRRNKRAEPEPPAHTPPPWPTY